MEEALHNLGIEGGALIAQAVNFGLLLFVLWKFLYRPILKVLDDRAKKVEESQLNAEKLERTLAKAAKDQEKILNEVKKEADQIIKEARKSAKEVEKSIVTGAEVKAKEIVAKAALDAEKEKSDSLNELKNEVSRLIEASLISILGQKGKDFDDQLINEALEEVK